MTNTRSQVRIGVSDPETIREGSRSGRLLRADANARIWRVRDIDVKRRTVMRPEDGIPARGDRTRTRWHAIAALALALVVSAWLLASAPHSSTPAGSLPVQAHSVITDTAPIPGTPGIAPTAGNPPADRSLAVRVIGDTSVRQAFGFRADPAYVTDMVRRSERHEAGVEELLGTPFTTDEAREMRARVALQDHAYEIEEYGQLHPDSYGGMYIDHPAGGKAVVTFTTDLAIHAAALQHAFSMPDRLIIKSVKFTDHELLAAAQAWDANSSRLGGATLSIVGLMPQHNALSITVSRITPAVRALASKFPTGMVELHEGVVHVGSLPVTGGSYITDTTANLDCTAAFSYRATNGYGFFTAGHCAGLTAGPSTHDKIRVNYPTPQTYTSYGAEWGNSCCSTTDSMAIPAVQGDTTNRSGFITVVGYAGTTDDRVGTGLCEYGAYTARYSYPGQQVCGTVQAINPSTTDIGSGKKTYWTRNLFNSQLCNFFHQGDSGGPVYGYDSRAYGILHGYVGYGCGDPAQANTSIYSAIAYANQRWGVSEPR
jgi:hypothetical protein